MQKITPFLWFDDNAEEATKYYVSVFGNSRIRSVARYGEAAAAAAGRPKGSVMTVVFELEGQEFVALNGGPQFHFTEAVSFVVNCDTQKELDEMWEKLSDGGEKVECGWLKDRFGISWRFVPAVLGGMAADPDPARSQRVMQALMGMKKIDIAELKRTYGRDKAA